MKNNLKSLKTDKLNISYFEIEMKIVFQFFLCMVFHMTYMLIKMLFKF